MATGCAIATLALEVLQKDNEIRTNSSVRMGNGRFAPRVWMVERGVFLYLNVMRPNPFHVSKRDRLARRYLPMQFFGLKLDFP